MMSDKSTPIRVYLGTFPVADAVTIPAEALRRANDEIDRERERRRLAAEEEQAAAEREAYAKSWRGRLGAMWRAPLCGAYSKPTSGTDGE